jgi:hypothetical protein
MGPFGQARRALGLVWRRQVLLARARAAGRALVPGTDRSAAIRPGEVLLFASLRNEAARLPYFLDHYRRLGVGHFLIVDNDSADGTADLLRAAPDVSFWTTGQSYRAARFGMDWVAALMRRHAAGHWCVTVDADELLVYPGHEEEPLPDFTRRLDAAGVGFMAALMLDLYPRGPLSQAHCPPGTNPAEVLCWFDADGYDWERQPRFGNISVRGGVRRRAFFARAPHLAPHLHKTPLVRWRRGYVYASSTHLLLPRRLNAGFDARLGWPTGVLLHSKFAADAIPRAIAEKARGEHFTHPDRYDGYYDAIAADPVLWTPASARLEGPGVLEAAGLMTRGRLARADPARPGPAAPAVRPVAEGA